MDGKKPKGISACSSFIDDEAECSDKENSIDELFDGDTDCEGFIDEEPVEQGDSLRLYNQLQSCDSAAALDTVKRNLPQTTKRCALGSLDSNTSSKKARLEDSGYAAETSTAEVEVDIGDLGGTVASGSNYLEVLKAHNARVAKLTYFKKGFTVGFGELTRPFKSNKTCCPSWVLAVYGAAEEVLESSKIQLQQYADFIYLNITTCPLGFLALYLLYFKAAKSRDTVHRLITGLLNVADHQILSDPPKLRSTPAALYWYKTGAVPSTFTYGEYPDWICQQTMISHQCGEVQFDLSKMVQWAYDNDFLDESDIAYNYAKLAPEDENAAAWLKSNSQVKYVKECSQMARYYKRAERREMPFTKWLTRCIEFVEGNGDWRIIVKFLRYQNVNFVNFMCALKDFFNSRPKHNCIVLYGHPNTGKSLFAMSLLEFLHGKVISFANSRSHFWLSPLADCKFAVLDDATIPTWNYFDIYMRNALDGNYVCVDTKHKQPVQIKIPPLLITTNHNVMADPKYMYLHSRLQGFEFPNEFPLTDNGYPAFQLTSQNWKAFFMKFRRQLELPDLEDSSEDGDLERPFRCVAAKSAGHY